MATNDKKELTEQEQKFIDALYGEAEGDPETAKVLAGYPKGTSLRTIVSRLSDDVVREVQSFIAINAWKAHKALSRVIDNPSGLGSANLVAAANSVLDRAGITKKDKIELPLDTPMAILILPPKNT